MNNIDIEEAEKVVKFCTEIQTCKDKRTAFIKGVLYGLGFAGGKDREPNWEIIKKIISDGKNDPVGWIDIEKSVYDIYKKVYNEHVELWNDLLELSVKEKLK